MVQLYVRTSYQNRLIALDMETSHSIDKVKAEIQDRTGIPAYQQHLIFRGTTLDGDRTLSDYNITQYDIINMLFASIQKHHGRRKSDQEKPRRGKKVKHEHILSDAHDENTQARGTSRRRLSHDEDKQGHGTLVTDYVSRGHAHDEDKQCRYKEASLTRSPTRESKSSRSQSKPQKGQRERAAEIALGNRSTGNIPFPSFTGEHPPGGNPRV